MKNKKNILLLGSYGRGNIGDDVFLYVLAKKLKNHQIATNCFDKKLLSKEIQDLSNIDYLSTNLWQDLIKKCVTILRSDIVIYGGGNVWVELYGNFFERRILYSMLGINTIARLLGKKIIYLSVGSGNISGWSLFLAKISATLAHQVYIRDSKSNKIINDKRSLLVPDIAALLTNDTLMKSASDDTKGKKTIVISVLHALPEPREQSWLKLKNDIIAFIQKTNDKDANFVLLPMYISEDKKNDLEMAKQIMQKLPDKNISIYTNRSLEGILNLLKSAYLVIGTRLHANIISVLCETPTIGIAYREKVFDFFKDTNLSPYCISLDDTANLSDMKNIISTDYKKVKGEFVLAKKDLKMSASIYEKIFTTIIT